MGRGSALKAKAVSKGSTQGLEIIYGPDPTQTFPNEILVLYTSRDRTQEFNIGPLSVVR